MTRSTGCYFRSLMENQFRRISKLYRRWLRSENEDIPKLEKISSVPINSSQKKVIMSNKNNDPFKSTWHLCQVLPRRHFLNLKLRGSWSIVTKMYKHKAGVRTKCKFLPNKTETHHFIKTWPWQMRSFPFTTKVISSMTYVN